MAGSNLMKKIKTYSLIIITLYFTLGLLTGCKTTHSSRSTLANMPSVPGKYHKVKRGETLWGISRTYRISLNEIVSINRIPDASTIKVGQMIFIPDEPKKPIKTTSYKTSNKISKPAEDNFLWPVKGKVIRYYGLKYDGIKSKGIKIKARSGEEVKAARSGTVSFCEDKLKGKGKTIIIDHHDGFLTVYAHNSENLVDLGEEVRQGDVIALAGSTGRCSYPQLYFEIRKEHKPQNPFYYLP
jgi:murein DD-endopeptidase MepM/ murein hydrolase activator NlpD